MQMIFCPDCHRYHAKGMCAENPHRPAPATVPVPDPWAMETEEESAPVQEQWPELSKLPEPARQEPQRDLLPRPQRQPLSSAVDRWIKTYEQHLAEFASETGGVPTKAHVRRAEELADRETRIAFNT